MISDRGFFLQGRKNSKLKEKLKTQQAQVKDVVESGAKNKRKRNLQMKKSYLEVNFTKSLENLPKNKEKVKFYEETQVLKQKIQVR